MTVHPHPPPRDLRVALVVWKLFPSFLGGTERHTLALARALGRCGVFVDVICASRPEELPPDEPFRVIPIGWYDDIPDLIANAIFSRRAAALISPSQYDIAYGQNLALWQCAPGSVPLVMNPHGMEPMFVTELWPRLRGTVRRHAFRVTARRATRVISLGGRLTEQLVRFLKVPREKIVEIPNAIEIEDVDRRLLQLGNPPRRRSRTLLYVGRLSRNKGLEVLFQALRLLRRGSRPIVLVVGSGPLKARLQAAAPAEVEFLGRLSDLEITQLFRRADGLVLPSLYEGMPTVVLEAMAHRIPVIASDIGAVATMVDHATGFLVPPGEPTALADAIKQLSMLDDRTWCAMGDRARERVEQVFTWPAVARQTVGLFEELRSTRHL